MELVRPTMESTFRSRCQSMATQRPGTHSNRYNPHTEDKLHPTGWLRVGTPGAALYVQRPDSRSKYLPQIDIPSVHHQHFAPPETLHELHADMMHRATQSRSASAPPVMHPGDPSRATKQRRRDEFNRAGNNLPAWGCGPLDRYRSILPHGKHVLGASLPQSGLLLPPPLMTSQGLFGPMPSRSGCPEKLRSVATSMPHQMPRFMVHDVKSGTSSTYSNFFKTSIAPGANSGGDFTSEQVASYQKPGTPYLRSSNFGARGIKTEMFGKTYESSGQQPWRQQK